MDKETTSLIKGYLEKAKEKLKVADDLLKLGDYADAASRAYYCAFHATQAVLLTEGLSAETHRGLVSLFGLHFVKTEKFDKKFGKILSNLKDDRENGDYEVYSCIDEEVSTECVKEAREFLEGSEKYLAKFL